MPTRIPTNTRLRQPTFRPVQRAPVAVVGPQQNSAVAQLADSLRTVQPSLARFAGVLGERRDADQKQEGEAQARALIEQGKSFREAIESGAIRKDQSEWFRVGAYETFGRAEGGRYIGNFLDAFNASPAAQSLELDAFDKFEREFRQQYLQERMGEDTDPFMANAFGSSVDARMETIRNAFAEQAGKRMEEKVEDDFHTELFSLVEGFQGTDYTASEIAAAIRLAQDRQVVTGALTYDQANRITAASIGAAAIRFRDLDILDLLDQIPTDVRSKGYLGGTSYGAETRRRAEQAIVQAMDDDARRQNIRDKATRDAAISGAVGSMVTLLQQDPGADVSQFVRAVSQVDPDYVSTLMGVRNAIRENAFVDDPVMQTTLVTGIYSTEPGQDGYVTMRNLDSALAQRRITPETYRTYAEEIQKRDAAGGTGRYINNTYVSSIGSDVRSALSVEDWMAFEPEEVEGIRANAISAANEAQSQMIRWLQTNPNASPSETIAQKDQIASSVIQTRSLMRRQVRNPNAPPRAQGLAPENIKPGQFFPARPEILSRLSSEFEEMRQGRRGAFSTESLDVLRRNNINPRRSQEIQLFITEAQNWLNSREPKP